MVQVADQPTTHYYLTLITIGGLHPKGGRKVEQGGEGGHNLPPGENSVARLAPVTPLSYTYADRDAVSRCGGHIDDHQTQLLTQLLNTTQLLLKCA